MNIKYSIKNYLNLTTHTALGMSLPVWIRLMIKNKFAVNLLFLPKILFITGNILLNTPFQIYEYLRFNKRIKNTKVQRPVFILGHPRSGTTYLQYVLCKDSNFSFCSTHEALIPHTFLTIGKFTRAFLHIAMPKTRPQDNVKAGADLPKEEEFALGNSSDTSLIHGYYFPKNIFRYFDETVLFENTNSKLSNHWKKHFDYYVKKIIYKYPGKRILLKSPANTGRVKEILELYPDACFIHIHRHPYAVYQSNEKLYEKILPLLSFQKADNKLLENYILYSFEKMYRKYFDNRTNIPVNQLFELSYTDFVSAPTELLKKAYEHLDLGIFEKAEPYFMEEIKSTNDYRKNSYSALNEKTKQMIDEKWAFFFDEYGYENS